MRVRPAAPKDELLGWNPAGELRVSVAAPPAEGKANKRLVAFLAKRLSVKRGEIRIESGEQSRTKILSAPEEARTALEKIPEI